MNGILIALNELGTTNSQETEIVLKGRWPHALGVQVVDAAAIERIFARMNSQRVDVSVDYNHGIVNRPVTQESGKAAGWIKWETARITEGGITAVIEWNPPAANMIRAKEYRYLSPVFMGEQVNGEYHINGLFNVALLNVPNIPQKPLSNESQTLMEKPTMELKKLAQVLGLPESATEAECEAAIAAMKTGAAAANGVYAKLAANDAATAMTKIIELQKPPAHSPGDIAAMQATLARLEKQEGDTLIANAMAAGKLAPAQKAWAENYYSQNPEGFRDYLANAAVVVPTKSAATGAALAANGAGVMTDTDREIAAMMGVSEDSFKKHNGLK